MSSLPNTVEVIIETDGAIERAKYVHPMVVTGLARHSLKQAIVLSSAVKLLREVMPSVVNVANRMSDGIETLQEFFEVSPCGCVDEYEYVCPRCQALRYIDGLIDELNEMIEDTGL